MDNPLLLSSEVNTFMKKFAKENKGRKEKELKNSNYLA